MPTERPHILIDFDHTLAKYSSGSWPSLGEPHPQMVKRVKDWRAAGLEVRLFTARVNDLAYHFPSSVPTDVWLTDCNQREALRRWCIKHIGEALPLTNMKTYDSVAIIDDRAFKARDGEFVGEEFIP